MSVHRFLAALAAVTLAAGCSTTPEEPADAPATPESAQAEPAAAEPAAPEKPAKTPEQIEEATNKVLDLTNQSELAKRKLERAQMDAEQQKADGDAAVQKATVERDLAKKALQHFDAVEMPQRLAKAELDLKVAGDNMTEQQEEMQQLELMYEKDDLADKTKEIVLARGKRRVERAKTRLALSQKDFDDLKGTQLPEQREKLAQALRDKEVELKRAEFNRKTGQIDKETAILAAQHEIEKLGREMEKAKKTLAAAEEAAGRDRERLMALGYVASGEK